jgi:hypothetical protein
VSAFDPEGLEIQFMTTKDLNEPSGAKAVVPYTPTETQQKAFNDAMGKLRDKGGDLGKALYNAANSSGKDAVKLEVQHAPGEIPGGQREVRDKETGNIIQNPFISLDLDEKNFSSARTVPGEQKKSYEAQISADPAVIVGHELGHALVEAEDPENVTAVENPLRKSLEEPKGPRKKYRSYQVPSVASPETAQKVKDFTKKWKDATPTPPTPPEKKPKQ